MTSPHDHIVAHVVHARSVPASAREQFAAHFRSDQWQTRGLLLQTCHRVEFYAANPGQAGEGLNAKETPVGGRELHGEAAIRHALSVAVGRDSIVVGEDQVLHQLRQAITAARDGGALDPVLDRLFALALRAGRRARSWRAAPSRSLADVAIELLRRGRASATGWEVLIVGSGDMGRLAAHAAVEAGARTPSR